LVDAAKIGNAQHIRELLKKGARIVAEDQGSYSAFDWAAIRGHSECLGILFDELCRTNLFSESEGMLRLHNITSYESLLIDYKIVSPDLSSQLYIILDGRLKLLLSGSSF